MMDRQVKPAHHLDFSRQHHVMLSGWCLPPTAGTNQATAATAATAALLLLPLLLLLLPLLILPLPLLLLLLLPFLPQRCFCHVAAFASATAPSATFKLLENGIAFAVSLSWLLAYARQLLLCHCRGCWQMQQLLHHRQCLCLWCS